MIGARVTKDRYTIDPLYQWDKNQVLQIYGLSLPSIPEIHFSNKTMNNAIVKQASMDNAGVVTVDIPNSLLEHSHDIIVYICTYEGDAFQCLYKMIIPVSPKKKPDDYITPPDNTDEVYSYNALENLFVNSLALSINNYDKAKRDYDAAAQCIQDANQVLGEAEAAKTAANAAAASAEQSRASASNAETAAANAETAAANAETAANAAKERVKKVAPRNLLDNSDFRNPVNQRGNSQYKVSGYTIDRWHSASTDLTINITTGECIEISNASTSNRRYFQQRTGIKAEIGKVYTVACYDKTNNALHAYPVTVPATGSYTDGGNISGGTLRLINEAGSLTLALAVNASSTVRMRWIALYEGEYTADTLPEYQPKGYAVELAECRRYYQRWGKMNSSTGAAAVGYCYSATSVRVVGYIEPMRIASPTISLSYATNVPAVISGGKTLVKGNLDFTGQILKDGTTLLLLVTVEGATTYNPAILITNSECYFELSADL